MKFTYVFLFIGIGVTCYRITRCLERIGEKTSNDVLKTVVKILFYPLAILSLPYVLLFSWLEIYEEKEKNKKHLSDLRTVKYLATLTSFPSKLDCSIYKLPSPEGYSSFDSWRNRIYEDLGLY